jgi:hypothetical protein
MGGGRGGGCCDAPLLVLLAFPPPSSSSHHLIPSYLHIPWHWRLAWNLLNPFGFYLLTKCKLVTMRLRFSVNCGLPQVQGLIPTSPTMVHNPTTDHHSRHNSKLSQDFWKDKLSDTLEQHLPPLWLTTQPQITTPKTTLNCLGTSQGTTLGDALE